MRRLLPLALGVGLVASALMGIPLRVWTQGAMTLSGLIVKPPVDGNQMIVTTASGAQFFNVQTLTHILGAVGGAWGTGAKTGSSIIAGRNSSGNGAAGYYIFGKKDGNFRYCWMDVSNNLRCGAAPPEEDGTPSDTSGSTIGGGSGTLWPNTLLVTDYGAVCDGSTDDASAIQSAFDAAAALDAATILFPAATCNVGSTLTLGGGDGSGDGSTFISLVGVAAPRSKLAWTGSTSGTMLRIELNKYFHLQDLGFANTVARGTTVGVRLTGNTDNGGTQTHEATFARLLVDGFHTGMIAGEAGHGRAASEIVYDSVGFQNNDTGWANEDLNTLNQIFRNVGCGDNGVCLAIDSGNVYVTGGSTHGSTVADFTVQQGAAGAGLTAEIRNVRSEHAERFVYGYSAYDGGNLLIENNQVESPDATDEVCIDLAPSGPVQIRGNALSCKVLFYDSKYASGVIMEGNRVKLGDATRRLPFIIKGFHANDDNIGRLRIVARLNQNASDVFNYDSYFDDVEGLWVNDNLRPVRRIVWGNADQAIPSQQISATSFGQNPWTVRKNVRVGGKFATSGTLAIAFTRTETVTSDGSGSDTGTRKWQTTANHFTTSDIGRRITFSNGGTFYAYITKIVDSTHIEVMFMASGTTTGTGITATVGEDEPDANYQVIPGCSAAESIGISSKASTGFTATSSNASSTAECTFLIVG